MTGVPGARVLVIEHDPECPVGLLGLWLEDAGCTLDVRRPHAGDELPALADGDALVVLGGPMGAGDDEAHGWLGPVKTMLREAHARQVPSLGVCLGHQLIAVALGGAVERNPRGQQVGLLDVGWTPAARDDALLGPLATPRRGVHWNDDIVTVLPSGAVLLAATPDGEAQAVRYGPATWGVQLHPEVDDALLGPWAEEDRGSHETRGIDTDALLAEIRAARSDLDAAWQPLASGLAALARRRAGERATT